MTPEASIPGTLGKLLAPDGEEEPDADGFWERVATNIAAARLRLLFVADDIPDPLERVVEFLNAQMARIEVLAVEIKQFNAISRQIGTAGSGRTAASTGASAPRSNHLSEERVASYWVTLPGRTPPNDIRRLLRGWSQHTDAGGDLYVQATPNTSAAAMNAALFTGSLSRNRARPDK